MKQTLFRNAAVTSILCGTALGLATTTPVQAATGFLQRMPCQPTLGTNFADTLEVFMDSNPPDAFTDPQFSFFSAPLWVGGTVDPRHAIAIGIAPDAVQMLFDLNILGTQRPLTFDYVLWDGGPFNGVIVDAYRVMLDGAGGYKTADIAEADINFGSVPIGPVLFVTANDQARNYGDPNPAFTVDYTGFVNGDTSSNLTGTLSFTFQDANQNPVATIDAHTPPGTYAILPAGLATTNYTITFAAGTLTVRPPTWALHTTGFDNAGKIHLQISSVPTGSTYVIERSSDLVNWAQVLTGPVTAPSFSVTDSPDAVRPVAFYRLRIN